MNSLGKSPFKYPYFILRKGQKQVSRQDLRNCCTRSLTRIEPEIRYYKHLVYVILDG